MGESIACRDPFPFCCQKSDLSFPFLLLMLIGLYLVICSGLKSRALSDRAPPTWPGFLLSDFAQQSSRTRPDLVEKSSWQLFCLMDDDHILILVVVVMEGLGDRTGNKLWGHLGSSETSDNSQGNFVRLHNGLSRGGRRLWSSCCCRPWLELLPSDWSRSPCPGCWSSHRCPPLSCFRMAGRSHRCLRWLRTELCL